ncbi:eotaxin-like [Xiphophorus couchianus]|uniref:Chemokine interleukin-8-like domain-containing protein n=1 Tax=Xiphophorus couchianus TaxID=32473 RepID=A0A3B5LHM8_9TELE|nr:eotaxin-like [Xiphophorus couchianus]XP_027895153.1 eotaxin-like [Xiphophorus couchianus]
MKAANILLLCMLGAALLSTVLCNSASGPDDCCFQFFRNPVNKNLISSYFRTDSRCPISAVVLITQRARRICVDSQEKWVEKIVKHLEKKIL